MTPTVQYVEEKIREFNDLIFSSTLPPIKVKLSHARTFLGKVQYRRTRGLFGRVKSNTDFLMRISTQFDLTEREQEDVIIHEMIHYFIAYTGLRDTSAHGPLFREHMDRINREFGRNVTIRHKSSADAAGLRLREIRLHHVCVSLFTDGRWGVTVCSEAKARDIDRLLPKYYLLEHRRWYTTTDPYFNRFPNSRTPKIYKISRADLDLHLQGAQPFSHSAQ